MKAPWLATMLLSLCCAAAAPDEPLDPEQAFELSVRALSPAAIEVHWRIADGCYLYRDKFRFFVDGADIRLGTPRFSPAEVHVDRFMGNAAIYRREATVVLPISSKDDVRSVSLRAEFQGCDGNRGICYPVSSTRATVELRRPAIAKGKISN